MVQIKFNDGTVITCEINGTSFITNEKPNFPEDFSNIMVTSEDGQVIIKNGLLIECAGNDNRYWFTIIEKPIQQLLEEQIEALQAFVEQQDIIISDLLLNL